MASIDGYLRGLFVMIDFTVILTVMLEKIAFISGDRDRVIILGNAVQYLTGFSRLEQ